MELVTDPVSCPTNRQRPCRRRHYRAGRALATPPADRQTISPRFTSRPRQSEVNLCLILYRAGPNLSAIRSGQVLLLVSSRSLKQNYVDNPRTFRQLNQRDRPIVDSMLRKPAQRRAGRRRKRARMERGVHYTIETYLQNVLGPARDRRRVAPAGAARTPRTAGQLALLVRYSSSRFAKSSHAIMLAQARSWLCSRSSSAAT